MPDDLPLGGSLPPSSHGSREGSTSSLNILATSSASGVTMRRCLSYSPHASSSSSSDEIRRYLPQSVTGSSPSPSNEAGQAAHMAVMQERAKVIHLEQELAQARHMLDRAASLPLNGAATMHDNGFHHAYSQLANSGMMTGTEYHSPLSAYTLPGMSRNPYCPPMFSPRPQVFNSREPVDMWQASHQPEMMNSAPLASNHFDTNSQRSASHGMQSPANFLSGGQVSMSMLEGDPQFLFANLVEHYRHSTLDDVKRGLFPILLHKIRLTGMDLSDAHQILHVILESSDFFEVLRMRCFDQVLLQRIHVAKNERARVAGPKFLPREEGSVSNSSHDFRAQSEAGSARLPTPSSQVENIIRNLLCGQVDEAAAELSNIRGDLNTQISRGSVPALPLKDTMNAQPSADASMTMSAFKTLVSEARNNAEKVKFTTFKNAGTGKDETPVDDITWTWEIEFASANIEPNVSRVLGLMTPGGNLRSWADTFRSVTRDTRDPNDISNWTWQRFRDELHASTMYSAPDLKKLLDTFENVTCSEPGTPEQLTAFTHAFTLAFQELRRHRMHERFSIASQAQQFYNKLPKLVKHHMALRDPMRKNPELRENLSGTGYDVYCRSPRFG
jgi:hypothetical protein